MADSLKSKRAGRSKRTPGSPRATVTLPASDWSDLVHFVRGDLDNMPADDEICIQMRRICDTIENRFIRAQLRAENNQILRREASSGMPGSES